MKICTHPLTTNTLIQTKDGSSYVKHWSYLRSTLILEGDPKKWALEASRRSKSFSKHADIPAKQDINPVYTKKNIGIFWIS